MTDIQQQAIEAIKGATGWDAIPVGNGARVERPNNGPEILLVWSDFLKDWRCQICLGVSWLSERNFATPEAALAAVLPRYRAHVAALAADILPNWPRLTWIGQPYARTLCLVVGGFMERILTVYPERTVWTVSIDNVTGPQRTREAVLAAVTAHVESLALPCPLPPFPGASDA